MATRFRRTLKIAPGIRLNLSRGSLSLSGGVRGASMTVGKRGLYANTGLPGSGLSYRTRIDKQSGTGRTRASYRELNRSHLADQRAHDHDSAASQVEAFETEVAALTGILQHRDGDVFDWEGRLQADRIPVPPAFSPPAFEEAAERIALNDASKVTRWRWIGGLSLGAAIVTLVLDSALVVLAMMGVAAAVIGLPVAHIRRWRQLTERRDRFEADLVAQRALHEAERDILVSHAALAPRIRTALSTGDPEALAELLEEELANETLPVPLVFDVDFDGVEHVAITLTLPEPDEVPSKRLSLTKTGRLSRRAMTQKMRREIFGSLACGLALRVAYEALRVLRPLTSVEVRGTSEQINPATGHPEDVVSLAFRVTRDQLDTLNLDALTPEAAIKGLGGEFACDRKCVLGTVTLKEMSPT